VAISAMAKAVGIVTKWPMKIMARVPKKGYSVLNSFYMAIITISTVGFKEVQPLSERNTTCNIIS